MKSEKSEKCKFGSAIIAAVVILAVLVFVLAASSASAAKTWYVDDDGGQDFTRIQAAVVAASDGDTIYVYEGYYNEIVTLDKELTVMGENKTTTIIDGNKIKDVVKMTADNCSLCEFTVKNSASSYAGVSIYEGKNANVSGNKIDECYYGVWIRHGSCVNHTSGALVADNKISSGIYKDSIGICVTGSNYNTIIGNDVQVTNSGRAIYMGTSNHNTITDNYLNGNDYGIYIGLSSEHNTVANNDIHSYDDYGVWLEKSSSYNTIADNTIRSRYDEGIRLYDSCNNNNIEGNDIVSEYDHGVYLYKGNYNTINDNDVVAGTDDNGIYLYYSN